MAISRRAFLQSAAGAAVAVGAKPLLADDAGPQAERCLVVNLVGGPSQLETWDPKPDAPSDVRGPFASIATSVPGLRISELFPKLAARAGLWSVVRSLHHDGAPIHETGYQLLQTGRLSQDAPDAPRWDSTLQRALGGSSAILPGPIESLGVSSDCGQRIHRSGDVVANVAPGAGDARYGDHAFGRLLATASRTLERHPYVTVNLFSALQDRTTWDCHADGFCLRSSLADYRATLAPAFDQAFSALLDDLAATGRLASTLVLAQGEFGRTPKLNATGGRDHWPRAWSMLFAGGGVQGGRIVGETDAWAGEPIERPVHASAVPAAILHAFGLAGEAAPIRELF